MFNLMLLLNSQPTFYTTKSACSVGASSPLETHKSKLEHRGKWTAGTLSMATVGGSEGQCVEGSKVAITTARSLNMLQRDGTGQSKSAHWEPTLVLKNPPALF